MSSSLDVAQGRGPTARERAVTDVIRGEAAGTVAPEVGNITRDQIVRKKFGDFNVSVDYLNGPGLWITAAGGFITTYDHDGNEVWTNSGGINTYHPTRDELTQTPGSTIVLLDAETGSRTQEVELPSGAGSMIPDTRRDQYFINRGESVQILEATDSGLEPGPALQINPRGLAYHEGSDTLFAIAGGELVALQGDNLAERWRRNINTQGILLVNGDNVFVAGNRGLVLKFALDGRQQDQRDFASDFPGISFNYTTDFSSDQSTTDMLYSALETYNVWIRDPNEGAVVSIDTDLNLNWSLHLNNHPPNSVHFVNIGGEAGLAVGTGDEDFTSPGGYGVIWQTNAPIADSPGGIGGPGDGLPGFSDLFDISGLIAAGMGTASGATAAAIQHRRRTGRWL